MGFIDTRNFSYLDDSYKSTVSFGDNSSVQVKEKGNVKLKSKNGFVENITDVLYVLALKTNILSVGQLQEKGYMISIEDGVCKLYDDKKRSILSIKMNSNILFHVIIDEVRVSLVVAPSIQTSKLWRNEHFVEK